MQASELITRSREENGKKERAFYLKLFCVPSLCGSVNQHFANLMFLTCIFKYADPVADLLDRWGVFRARLFRESCVFHRGNYVKDLSRLGRELSKVIIVDNSPASYIFHPENAVSIQSAGAWLHLAGPCPGFGIQKIDFSERWLVADSVVCLGCRWVLGCTAKWWRTWAKWSWQMSQPWLLWALSLGSGWRSSSFEKYQVVWDLKNQPSSKKQSCPAAQVLFFGVVITLCLNFLRYSHLFPLCEQYFI